MWMNALKSGFIWGTVLTALVLTTGLVASLIAQSMVLFYIAGILTFMGSGILLFLGGCLFSRQPLVDEKRFNSNGTPTPVWKRALLGLDLMSTAIILFFYGLIINLIGAIFRF
ncbi:MAG: hypothetical protein ACXACD_20535 [Candidatus Thorarchaeota archaeon]